MTQCEYCGETIVPHINAYQCKECGRWYCKDHLISHGCKRQKVSMKTASDFETFDKIGWEPSAGEFPYLVYPPPSFTIEPPIKCEVGETIELPKQLFPFTEDTLKFELYRKLEKMGVEAYLDPGIMTERELTLTEWLKLQSGEKKYANDTTSKRPDIVIDNFKHIWEVKSGLTRKLELGQAAKYSQTTGMPAYTIAWECPHWYEFLKYNLVLINPITGAVKAPSHFFAPGKLKYKLELKPRYHTEMQYEFFEKLRESGHEVTAEVEYGPNIIFAPDEITISKVEGIKDWKPDPFSAGPLERIGREKFPQARGDCWGKVDIVSKHKDETTIDGYEVEAEKFDPQQWRKMMNSRVFGRVWIVVPSQAVSAVKRFIADHDSLKPVGLIAYFSDEKIFDTIREAGKLTPHEKSLMKIKVEP